MHIGDAIESLQKQAVKVSQKEDENEGYLCFNEQEELVFYDPITGSRTLAEINQTKENDMKVYTVVVVNTTTDKIVFKSIVIAKSKEDLYIKLPSLVKDMPDEKERYIIVDTIGRYNKE